MPAVLLLAAPTLAQDYRAAVANLAPTASAGPTPIRLEPGVEATFDASSSQDADGEVLDATWDFGDGTRKEGIIAVHTYERPGAYLALLTVRDDQGMSNSAPVMVHVGEQLSWTQEDFMVPVSDGYRLHARVFRPEGEGPFPIVMRYSLYCVSFNASDEALVRSGYVFIAAEAPGVCGSEGSFDLFGPAVARGGHDLVEWAASRTWSTEKVALVGHSGPAITGLAAARTRPEGLVTIVFGSTYVDAYRDAVYPGGVLSMVAPEFGAVAGAQPRQGMDPVARAPDLVNWEANVLSRPTDDAFWEERSLAGNWEDLQVPAYLLLSWNDLFARGAFEFFRNRVHPESRITMYPGPHWVFDPTGEMGFRTDQVQPVHAGSEERVWLDRWLKGIGGEDLRPDAALFIQEGGGLAAQAFSSGSWEFFDEWPLPGTEWGRLYLRSGRADSTVSLNDGRLLPEPPGTDEKDLLLPAHSAGLFDPQWLDFWAAGGHREATGRTHLGVPERTPDDAQGLTFTTETFDEPIRVIGPLTLTFHASLTGTDAAFVATVSDVWPDGTSHLLTTGLLRASTREIDEERTLRNDDGDVIRVFHPHDEFDRPVPGAKHEYILEIWPTANVFARGHRLRLTLHLAKAAWASPEPSTAGAILERGPEEPAHLLIPVVPDEG